MLPMSRLQVLAQSVAESISIFHFAIIRKISSSYFCRFCWGNLAKLCRSLSLSVLQIACTYVHLVVAASSRFTVTRRPSPPRRTISQHFCGSPRVLCKSCPPLFLCRLTHLPPTHAAAESRLKYCVVRLMPSFHPFWFKIELEDVKRIMLVELFWTTGYA